VSIREATGYVLPPDDGRAIWFLDALLTWKATGASTDGQWELVEQLGPHGFGPPVHSHDRESEGFYIIEGELSFILGEERLSAPAGSFVYIPPAMKHAFVVESSQAKFLTFVTPAALEAFLDELSVPAAARRLPGPLAEPLDVERFAAAAAKHGQKVHGPPPAPRAKPA
jgi:quercetin dioxygenase-like cupin family protein